MKTFIYCRISQDREGGGLGVARQEKDCRELAGRLGWQVIEAYIDDDISAYSGKPRPGYMQMVEALKNNEAEAVLAWHTDRLHRTPRDLEDYIDLADALSIRTETVKAGPIDLSSPSGRAIARTLCAWARFEVEHKSERALRKARELAEAGRIGNGGPRPFGYQRIYTGGTGNRRKIAAHVIDPSEAAIVRELAERILAGEALRAICRDLNERGITTTTGRPWGTQSMKYTMTAARMAGLREHHGEIVAQAVWEPILDRGTVEQLRAVLFDPARATYTGPREQRYLLSGLLHCGKCGHRLRPVRNASSQRFGCPARNDGGCGGILVVYAPLEELVVEALLRRLNTLAITPADSEEHDITTRLLAAIDTDEAKLRQLAAAYAEEPDADPLELRTAGTQLRDRIAEHRRQLAAAARKQAISEPATVRDAWPDTPFGRRVAVARALIETIDVGPAKPGNRFQPDRVTLRWR